MAGSGKHGGRRVAPNPYFSGLERLLDAEMIHPPEAVSWSPEVSARLRKERSELGLYLFECDTTTKLLTGKAVTWDQVCSLEDPNAKREPWFDEATARLIFVYSVVRGARKQWEEQS